MDTSKLPKLKPGSYSLWPTDNARRHTSVYLDELSEADITLCLVSKDIDYTETSESSLVAWTTVYPTNGFLEYALMITGVWVEALHWKKYPTDYPKSEIGEKI